MVRVGELQIRALLDTGSMVSLISEPVLHKIESEHLSLALKTDSQTYHGANLESLDLKPYTVTLHIDIEDVSTTVNCLIAAKTSLFPPHSADLFFV